MLGVDQAYAKALKDGTAYADVQRQLCGNSLIIIIITDTTISLENSDSRIRNDQTKLFSGP